MFSRWGGELRTSFIRVQRQRSAPRNPFIIFSLKPRRRTISIRECGIRYYALFPLLILSAALTFCACTQEEAVPDSGQPAPLTKSATVPADSIASDSHVHYGAITVDTTWAGEILLTD